MTLAVSGISLAGTGHEAASGGRRGDGETDSGRSRSRFVTTGEHPRRGPAPGLSHRVGAVVSFAPPTGHFAKGNRMARQAVSSDQAPAALGPYSQAIVAGGFVFCSGTAGIDPATGAVGDGIEAQTEQALRNLAVILEAAGASMADLVKVTIYYADVDDFSKLNEVYARHMPDPPPARSAPA